MSKMPGERSNTNTPLGNTNNHNSSSTAQRHTSQPQPQSTNPIQLISKIPFILPHERVFPIQIGSELYKLSGASLSSDGTSCAVQANSQRTLRLRSFDTDDT